MTCIIGLKQDGKLVVGADTRVTAGGYVVNTEANKLIEKDGTIMGICGYMRFADIIRSQFSVPPKPEGKSDQDFLSTEFANSMRTCLEGVKMVELKDGMSWIPDSAMIIVYKNNIYSMGSDYSICAHTDYAAEGSGTDYALGSLHATSGLSLDPKTRVTMALDAACKFNAWCAPPYTIIERNL